MDIRYLTDPKGITTGVFIPLAEWERLKQQYGIVEGSGDGAGQAAGAELPRRLREALGKAGLPEGGSAA